ncbi:nucleoside diphosphate kinase homolog 5-like [Xyrauchen texanus]|uniref:nucleoside diphosphate kinase homolog 5-like n=1 Tax=Xyrauchen texanus TaxID=154827 RepID=UPI0022428387|nr:nucleoside diphosphate kinase homolog 5-like [Xyrauchen texanus]
MYRIIREVPCVCSHVISESERTNACLNVMDEDNREEVSAPRIFVERTLALIKPDAAHKADEIEDRIIQRGFSILQKRRLQLSPEQCSDFYIEHNGKLFFPHLTAFMSSGPVVALVLARQQAIATWKAIMGPVNSIKARETHPDCLRARFGTCDLQNAVLGSESFSAAEREIRFIFPNSVIEPIPLGDYLSWNVSQTLLTGLTELCKRKPTDSFVSVITCFAEQYYNLLEILKQLCQFPFFFDILVLKQYFTQK